MGDFVNVFKFFLIILNIVLNMAFCVGAYIEIIIIQRLSIVFKMVTKIQRIIRTTEFLLVQPTFFSVHFSRCTIFFFHKWLQIL